MKTKPYVGMPLFSLNVCNAAHNVEQQLTSGTVVKVGRKYFTWLPDHYADSPRMGVQFHLDNWWEKTEYAATHCLYKTKQEWLDEKEQGELMAFIRGAFDWTRRNSSFDLIQLRKIKAILLGEGYKP